MNNLIIFFILIVLAILIYCVPNRKDDEVWEQYKHKFDKNYKNKEEDSLRKKIFFENLQKVDKHNELFKNGQVKYQLGMNAYSDVDKTEFVRYMNGLQQSLWKPSGNVLNETNLNLLRNIHNIPATADWRKKGAVTGIKDQGQCGSCWAFSATGALEGQHFLKTKNLVSLSEQNLIDCSGKYGNQGCLGGLMDLAFQYVKDNKGIDTEESYPYQMQAERCHYNPKNSGATDSGYVDLPIGDEKILQAIVAEKGPISVAIDASHLTFQFYRNGVYYQKDCSSENLDHGVLVVGYGRENGEDYWLVKNSWGLSWGDNGYIKMARNRNNNCGIATMASYPLV